MEIKRLDATPYLTAGEVVEYKTSAKKNYAKGIQIVLCWFIALLVMVGNGIIIGGILMDAREAYNKIDTEAIPFVLSLLVVELIPFAFWLGNIFINSKNKVDKWYALTNRRVLIVQGIKPVSVSFINISEISSFKIGKSSLTLLLGEEALNLNGIVNPKEMADKLVELFGDAKTEVAVKPVAPKKEEVQPVQPTAEEPTGEPEVVIADVGFNTEDGALKEGALEEPTKKPAVSNEGVTAEAQDDVNTNATLEADANSDKDNK